MFGGGALVDPGGPWGPGTPQDFFFFFFKNMQFAGNIKGKPDLFANFGHRSSLGFQTQLGPLTQVLDPSLRGDTLVMGVTTGDNTQGGT